MIFQHVFHLVCFRSSCEGSDLHGLAVINYEGRPKEIEKKAGKIANVGGEKNTKLKRHFDTSLCRTESGKVCLGDVKSLDKMPKELRKETVDRNIFLAIDYKYGELETDYGRLVYKWLRNRARCNINMFWVFANTLQF